MDSGKRQCWIALVLTLLVCGHVDANDVCEIQATTDLEKFFCRVQKTRYAATLPSFSDFQKNSPKVQASLLKGPARKLGWTLPAVSATKTARQPNTVANPSQNITASDQPGQRNAPAPATPPISVSLTDAALTPKDKTPPKEVVVSQPPLSGCHLRNEQIICPGRSYALRWNEGNKQLPPQALSAENKLQLGPYRGDPNDARAIKRYLGNAYQTYIEKLLSIGLAGSTMSYSKFHYTFLDLQQKREDFAVRLTTMFEYLKKDKASMAIKKRYSDKLPGSIQQCSELSTDIIVCDDSQTNWVFTVTP